MRKSRIRIVFWMVLFCQFVLTGNGVFSSVQYPDCQITIHAKKEVARYNPASVIDQYFESEDTVQEENSRKTTVQISGAGILIHYSPAEISDLQLQHLSADLSHNLTHPLFLRHRNLRI